MKPSLTEAARWTFRHATAIANMQANCWPSVCCVIIADDGLATGSTMQVAAQVVRAAGPKQVIATAPVCAPDAIAHVRPLVEQLIYLAAPDPFHAVGLWYDDSTQTGDDEVLALLAAGPGKVPRHAILPGPAADAVAEKKL